MEEKIELIAQKEKRLFRKAANSMCITTWISLLLLMIWWAIMYVVFFVYWKFTAFGFMVIVAAIHSYFYYRDPETALAMTLLVFLWPLIPGLAYTFRKRKAVMISILPHFESESTIDFKLLPIDAPNICRDPQKTYNLFSKQESKKGKKTYHKYKIGDNSLDFIWNDRLATLNEFTGDRKGILIQLETNLNISSPIYFASDIEEFNHTLNNDNVAKWRHFYFTNPSDLETIDKSFLKQLRKDCEQIQNVHFDKYKMIIDRDRVLLFIDNGSSSVRLLSSITPSASLKYLKKSLLAYADVVKSVENFELTLSSHENLIGTANEHEVKKQWIEFTNNFDEDAYLAKRFNELWSKKKFVATSSSLFMVMGCALLFLIQRI